MSSLMFVCLVVLKKLKHTHADTRTDRKNCALLHKLAGFAGVAHIAPPSKTSMLKVSVLPAALPSLIVHLCEQKQKKLFFMSIHNSCTLNGDNIDLLIKTGNAQKCRMLPQTTVNTFKKCHG